MSNSIRSQPNVGLDGYPALARVGIGPAELASLRKQGFVASEHFGGRCYYKLRFRYQGKQIVRYLGGPEQAEFVRRELADLQWERNSLRALRTLTKQARTALRAAKQTLLPLATTEGLVFHGLTLRRRRQTTGTAASPTRSRNGVPAARGETGRPSATADPDRPRSKS